MSEFALSVHMNRLWARVKEQDAEIDRLREQRDDLAAAVRSFIGASEWQRTHPGRPCRQPGHIPEAAYQRLVSALHAAGRIPTAPMETDR